MVVDEDGGNAMHVGPDDEGIGGGVGGGGEVSGLLADGDDADEVFEGLAAEEVGFCGFGEGIEGDIAEDEAVLVGVLDAELDVAADAGGKGFEGGGACCSIWRRRSIRTSKVSPQMASTISILFLK
ncbi:MAG: hypothetical protein NTX13_07465 [Acidobacteria bacterium]|nr:hypothetical protein [Acidobacteriota bacterium]